MRYMTMKETAQALHVSVDTVRTMIARGDIPARRIGPRAIRIPETALDAFGNPLTNAHVLRGDAA